MDLMKNLRDRIGELPKERILDFVEMLIANHWTLQNNWMVNIEKRYGHDVATEFDGLCYGRTMEVAVYRLKKLFNLGDDISALLRCIEFALVEPGTEGDFFQVGDRKIRSVVTKCEMQMSRRQSGLPELPCKPAMLTCIERFAKAVNPKLKLVNCFAPPDEHPDDLWCGFEIEFED